MYINIKLTSKNKNSLHKIYNFLYKVLKRKKVIIFLSQVKIEKNKSYFFLKKSPHVNNKSVECFGFIIYSINLTIYTINYRKIFLILKKFNIFIDVNISVKFILNKKSIKLIEKKLFNVDIYKYKNFANYLKLYDILGEKCFEKNINNSSI